MDGFNPFAPTVEIGGSAQAGGARAAAQGALSVGNISPEDNHVTAGLVLVALGVLFLLWRGKFRFSMTVGGRG